LIPMLLVMGGAVDKFLRRPAVLRHRWCFCAWRRFYSRL